MTTPEEQAAIETALEKQIKDLATQITQMTKLGFDPMTIRKGIIAAVDDNANPPTVSLNISGDTETLITQVRTLNNYTPLVGQTVLIAKQGTEIFLLGGIASTIAKTATAQPAVMDNGWIKATLTNGTHGGNANDVYYRRVLDHGAWKMQWRGVWNTSSQTFMINTADALDQDYRPTSYRALACARDAAGLSVIRMEFAADGTVRWFQANPTISTTGNIGAGSDIRLSGYLSQAGSDLGHAHATFTSDHNHGGSASIAVPSWVSLNGVEYFL